ncbi:MAG: hypothetical protein U5L10_03420 [Candidatus Moranbacteria bacterium]|nr:hypothetical protein [Candidatus Moranbacteria bacterium]
MLNINKKDFYLCRISDNEAYQFDKPVLHSEAMNAALGIFFQRKAKAVGVFDSRRRLVGAFFDYGEHLSYLYH